MDSRHRDDLAKGNGLTTYAESVIKDILQRLYDEKGKIFSS